MLILCKFSLRGTSVASRAAFKLIFRRTIFHAVGSTLMRRSSHKCTNAQTACEAYAVIKWRTWNVFICHCPFSVRAVAFPHRCLVASPPAGCCALGPFWFICLLFIPGICPTGEDFSPSMPPTSKLGKWWRNIQWASTVWSIFDVCLEFPHLIRIKIFLGD